MSWGIAGRDSGACGALQVDLDKSRGVDFFEFMYLGFLMTQDGSYSDLTDNSANRAWNSNGVGEGQT